MLASVYSYRVMVKSVSSCCVRGSRVLSNPVTYCVSDFLFLPAKKWSGPVRLLRLCICLHLPRGSLPAGQLHVASLMSQLTLLIVTDTYTFGLFHFW